MEEIWQVWSGRVIWMSVGFVILILLLAIKAVWADAEDIAYAKIHNVRYVG